MHKSFAALVAAVAILLPGAVFAGDLAKSLVKEAIKAGFSELERLSEGVEA